MIPRQMHGFLNTAPNPWCLWTDKQAQTGGKGMLLVATLELENSLAHRAQGMHPTPPIPHRRQREKKQIVGQEVV